MQPVITRHLRILLVLSVVVRFATWTLASLSAYLLPLFDESPTIWTSGTTPSVLLRWDAIHFAHMAQKGYIYEHEWAFFNGLPLLMRLSARLHALAGFGSNDWVTLVTPSTTVEHLWPFYAIRHKSSTTSRCTTSAHLLWRFCLLHFRCSPVAPLPLDWRPTSYM